MNIKNGKPSVLLAVKEELLLRTLRDMLRGYGSEKVKHSRTIEEASAVLGAHKGEWDIFLVDGALPDAALKIKTARAEIGPDVKILLMMSNPTKEEVMDAVQAGINDFIASPCPPAMFEEKLDKLAGR